MGIALGCIGVSYDDFCRCTPIEFQAIYKAWSKRQDFLEKSRWNRMRNICAYSVAPYMEKKVLPQELIPFPWEKGVKPKKERSRAEILARLEKIKKERGLR